MKTKHTLGPWKICPDNETLIISGDSSYNIATMWEAFNLINDGKKIDEAKANAHLIAAAPELLEALETLITVITSDCLNPSNDECNAMVYAAKKAIDKAKGKHN